MNYLHIGLLTLVLMVAGRAYAETTTDLDTIRRLAEEGRQEAALQQLDEHIAGDGNDVQVHFLKGLLLLERNDIAAAREVFAEMTRLFPHLPEVQNNLAVIYAGQGDYEQARRLLVDAAADAPDYATAPANLGDLYVKMAADAYRKTLELNPGDNAAQAKLRLIEQLLDQGS